MKPKIAYLIVMIFCCLKVVSQNIPPSGITITTSKKGAPLPESPLSNSKRHKLYFPAENYDLEYKLLYHEFYAGKYKANERFWEVVNHRIIKKDEKLIVELIPELHDLDKLLKIYVNTPGMSVIRRKRAYNENGCIKFLLFNMPKHTIIDSPTAILLAYEDSKNTNEVENILKEYLDENGLLPNTEIILNLLKTKINQYSLLFYTTKKMKNED